jgi:hypothetical protein
MFHYINQGMINRDSRHPFGFATKNFIEITEEKYDPSLFSILLYCTWEIPPNSWSQVTCQILLALICFGVKRPKWNVWVTQRPQCLRAFDMLTSTEVWQRAPDSVRQSTTSQVNYDYQNRNDHSSSHSPSRKSDFEERIVKKRKTKQIFNLLRNIIMAIKICQQMTPCIQHPRNQDSRLQWTQHSKHGSKK